MVSVVKPLAFLAKKGDLDSDSRPLQLLDTIHRSTNMTLARGRFPIGQSHFRGPAGVASYTGFGADGFHYEAGVKQRTWGPSSCIDDFTDKVTDTERWAAIGSDLTEGGIDFATNGPFGLRLHALYVGPGIETYDRKGKMLFTHPTSGAKAILSGRVSTRGEGSPVGTGLENCILLAIQQSVSDVDYIFVGYCNTTTYPFSVVTGSVSAGIPTVSFSTALTAGTTEVDVAIEVDSGTNMFQGFFNASTGEVLDLPLGAWTAIGVPDPFPFGWPANAVPRVHLSFPAGYTVGERHSMADVRVEASGGQWVGQQSASWFLEVSDGTNPTDLAGLQAECPDEVIVTWERDSTGACHLTLIDVDVPATPKMWRRWKDFGKWLDRDRNEDRISWTPGWLDADEGHIVLSRNTHGQFIETSQESKAELWVVSLRWDQVLVFHHDGVGRYLTLFNRTTSRSLREIGSWGGRRWSSEDAFHPETAYDQAHGQSSFVGTLRHRTNETVVPGLAYGVHLRRVSTGDVLLAYGAQEIPAAVGDEGKHFAGIIKLADKGTAFTRTLFRKNTGLTLWDRSDETWPVVGMSANRALYWTQAKEDGFHDEPQGLLCRKDFSASSVDNNATAAHAEDVFWTGVDRFLGRGLNLNLMDSSPYGSEQICLVTGWEAGSILTGLWYNSLDPENSTSRTYGHSGLGPAVSTQFFEIAPNPGFPAWLSYTFVKDNAELKNSRITNNRGVGTTSFLTTSNGIWLAYGHFDGITTKTNRYELLRGAAINRGGFALELEGRMFPPFAAGGLFNSLDSMTPAQEYKFYLSFVGEKRFRAQIGFCLKGNSGGGGGMTVRADISYLTGSGQVVDFGTFLPGSSGISPGALFKVRVRRQGSLWTFVYFDNLTNRWQTVLSRAGLGVPVLPRLISETKDAVGFACSVGIELQAMVLAPFDEPVGSSFTRPVDYAILPSVLASMGDATAIRDLATTPTSGRLAVSDNWFFSGVMPRP